MRRFAYWLFPTIAIIVAIFIIAFMIEINPTPPAMQEDTVNDESAALMAPDSSEGWISRFNVNKDKGYFYPVNEVTIELDSNKSSRKAQIHHLVVPLKDSYEFFCLKQELKNSDLPYLLNQEGKSMTVLIDSADRTELNALVAKLKTYQISATLSPSKED
ncbi:MAG TPA: hypothetical protein VFX57_03795 [Sulfuricurvum sp.]|nr:hypothetical protein [Sulfuricurvum sp.]